MRKSFLNYSRGEIRPYIAVRCRSFLVFQYFSVGSGLESESAVQALALYKPQHPQGRRDQKMQDGPAELELSDIGLPADYIRCAYGRI